MKKLGFMLAVASALLSGRHASAQTVVGGDVISVEVTNEGNSDFFLTPVWFGFHNGSFDLFDPGASASSVLETIAEVGDAGPLSADFAAAPGTPGDRQGVVASPTGPPPLAPGETAFGGTTAINASSYQFFSFASMVVPTNDTFIGNDDPLAYQVFDANDQFLGVNGVFEIGIFASSLYDAGTEVNDSATDGGAAFAVGRVGGEGAEQNGTIALVSGTELSEFSGLSTPAGTTIGDTTYGAGERIATIRIRINPSAVPEPSSLAMLGMGLVGVCARRRRR